MPPFTRLTLAAALATVATAAPAAPILDLPLQAPFHARTDWRLTVTQGPPMAADATPTAGEEPGALTLCLRKAPAAPCDPQLRTDLRIGVADDIFSTPRYLKTARVVHGAAGHPLLLVQTASLYSGDGDQLTLTQLLAYSPRADAFRRVFTFATGHNNNQDARFLEAGPLKGDIVAVEPTDKAPFAYWVTVFSPTKSGPYRQILRFRSATGYGDGNPLSVIDSEMPNTLQRLGLWRPGRPLPLPPGGCGKPHLVGGALWCQ